MNYAESNLKKRFLSPSEQLQIDWTLQGKHSLDAWPPVNDFPGKPSRYIKMNLNVQDILDQYYQNILSNIPGSKHQPYLDMIHDYAPKVKQQGGVVSRMNMEKMYESYYTHLPKSYSPHPMLIAALNYILDDIRWRVSHRGGVDYTIRLRYGTKQAALPTMYHKNDYVARAAYPKGPWQHVTPIIPGQRKQHNPRAIFMDSLGNYAYVAPAISMVKQWLLREYPLEFDAWRNPAISMRSRITLALQKGWTSLELDYEKMDWHFNWPLVRQFILPIYELLLDPGDYLHFAAAIEEYFTVPLYLGDVLWEGNHSLFSGIPPTNDFETIWDWIVDTAQMLLLKKQIDKVLKLKNGDDMLLMTAMSKKTAQWLLEATVEMASSVGLSIHSDMKSRIVQNEARFLSTVYYPGGRRTEDGVLVGAYPSNIALRNILMPEYPITNPGIAAVADLQRLDGCFGSPDWSQVVDLVSSKLSHAFLDVTEEDVRLYSERYDWWLSLYGESWRPEVSPSFNHILANKLSTR